MAPDSSAQNGTGLWHSDVWPIRASAFGPKGPQVYIEGRLATREYETKDGSDKRYRSEIVARQIGFVGNRLDGHND